MLSEKLKRRKKNKKDALCSVGDIVQCIEHGKSGKPVTGIVVKKIKRSKRFFDYIYHVATSRGILCTPSIVISKILNKS